MDSTVFIGANDNYDKGNSQLSENLTIQPTRSEPSISSSKISGINILTSVVGIDDIETKLKSCGLELKKILYFDYGTGKRDAILFYCITVHGQYVMIIPPGGTDVQSGDLALIPQRVGVLPSSTIETISSKLSNMHTDHVYISAGGIHLVTEQGNVSTWYGYADYKIAQTIFDIKKHHYILIPALQLDKLIEPARLNTLEAHINRFDKTGVMAAILKKSGLEKLFTMKGPITVFMPTDEHLNKLLNIQDDQLQAILLAHIVIGRIELKDDNTTQQKETTAVLTSPDKIPSLDSTATEHVAIAQNKIEIKRVNGIIVSVKSGSIESKVHIGDEMKPIHKYNGILYRINSVFTPINKSFKMPDRSDFDDVATIFDINRSTMEIRLVQYEINHQKHRELIEVISHIAINASTIIKEINDKYTEDGINLLKDSKLLMDLFYSREVPCSELCVEMDQLAELVKNENMKFEKLLRVSTQVSSTKVAMEQLLLKLARIDQKLHVDNIIDRPADPFDDEE